MNQSPERQVFAAYQLRVDGHLDHHWSPWFGDLTLTHENDGTTSLTGVVSDQAELHGLLTKFRDLGVTLISVALVDPSDSARPTGMRPAADHSVDGSALGQFPHPGSQRPELIGRALQLGMQ